MRWRATEFPQLDGSIDRPADDGVLLDDDGRECARVYLSRGLRGGEWFWAWQRQPCAHGFAPTKADAKAECERRAASQLHCSAIRADEKSSS